MVLGKKHGIVRRPLEYALWLAAFVLTALLLWAVSSLNKENQTTRFTNGSASNRPAEGTLDEIDWLTEQDEIVERSVDESYDEQYLEAASADSAADNIGGVYDEAEY